MLSIFLLAIPVLADPFTPAQIKERLEVRAEVFYTDPAGTKLLRSGGGVKTWRLRKSSDSLELKGSWSSNANEADGLVFRTSWTINPDNSIKVSLEEFGGEETRKDSRGEPEYQPIKPLKKQEFVLENFAPISWVSARPNAKERVVIRFTPSLREINETKPLRELPVSGQEMILTDSEGVVWADHVSARGKFVGLKTHKGAVLFSYYPFGGAREMGFAEGKKIELTLGTNRTLTILSATDFVPEGVNAVVYGLYQPGNKTGSRNSIRTSTSDKEKNLLSNLED